MVDSASNEARRILGLAKLWFAEIKLCATAVRELALGVGLEEAPDVKVFDAVLAIEVVECAALAQSDRKQSIAVKAAGFRLAPEQIGAIVSSDFSEAAQVLFFKWFV